MLKVAQKWPVFLNTLLYFFKAVSDDCVKNCIKVSLEMHKKYLFVNFANLRFMTYFVALNFPELSVATSSKFYCNWIVQNKFVFTASI